jgi:hypothetical protein
MRNESCIALRRKNGRNDCKSVRNKKTSGVRLEGTLFWGIEMDPRPKVPIRPGYRLKSS